MVDNTIALQVKPIDFDISRATNAAVQSQLGMYNLDAARMRNNALRSYSASGNTDDLRGAPDLQAMVVSTRSNMDENARKQYDFRLQQNARDANDVLAIPAGPQRDQLWRSKLDAALKEGRLDQATHQRLYNQPASDLTLNNIVRGGQAIERIVAGRQAEESGRTALGLLGGQQPQHQTGGLSSGIQGVLNDRLPAFQQAGIPIRVTSGFRTPEQNAAAGGARDSQHLRGDATDISLRGLTDQQKQQVVDGLLSDPRVGGFGYYPGTESIHIDTRSGGRAAWGVSHRNDSVGAGWPDWMTSRVRSWQAGAPGANQNAGGERPRFPVRVAGLPTANDASPVGSLPPPLMSQQPAQSALPPPLPMANSALPTFAQGGSPGALTPRPAAPAPSSAPPPSPAPAPDGPFANVPTANLVAALAQPGLPEGMRPVVQKEIERRATVDAPTEPQKNYQFYRRQEAAEGRTPKSFEDWQLTRSRAGASQVNVGGGSDKQVFDNMEKSAEAAQTVANGLTGLREARNALKGGGVFGAGADMRLGLQKIGALLGVKDNNSIVNTETFRAAIAPQVAAMLKATVGTTQISNTDREFAEKAAGGNISLDEGSIARLLDIMERGSAAVIQRHRKKLDAVYPEKDGKFERERALFGVDDPGAPPPPPEQPAQQQQTQQRAPVRVTRPEDAARLPSGTIFIDPNGVQRRVP